MNAERLQERSLHQSAEQAPKQRSVVRVAVKMHDLSSFIGEQTKEARHWAQKRSTLRQGIFPQKRPGFLQH
jgi:hypothetical protein